jgi:hypothetical protein
MLGRVLFTQVDRSPAAYLTHVKLIKGTLRVVAARRQGHYAGVAVADSGCMPRLGCCVF